MRKTYLDNIRWSTVLLVILYHIFYLFNSVGVFGAVGNFSEVQYQDAVLPFLYPWFMVLLFVVAGMSAKYALEKKTCKEFIKARTTKLLVPSTLGLLAFHWITGYFYIRTGGGIDSIPPFILYPICALSGTGPLWFAQVLWLYSLLIALIKKLDKKERLLALGKKCNLIIVFLLFLPLWGGAQLLNMPVLTTYRLGIYLVGFLIGYFILSHDEIQDKLETIHLPLVILAVLTGIAYAYVHFDVDYTSDVVLRSLFTNAYAWLAVLAVLSAYKAWFNKETNFTKYMTRANFGFYVLHYLPTLVICYLFMKSGLPAALVYIFSILLAYPATALLYEIIRRIPVYRYFVLGIKKKKEPPKTNETQK